ncbi:autotransporter domain-containing protein [Simkania sp.]|uniref:autotransporter family protein n=1 Tax=Simkania sp. TaxID=34094 RepID=UPI003B526A80
MLKRLIRLFWRFARNLCTLSVFIFSIPLFSSGEAIIGGEETFIGYAALVTPNGTLTEVSGGNYPIDGPIFSVAINSAGVGIIGGGDFTSPYAAFVAPNGTLTELGGGNFPSVSGIILNVAINNSGEGIIGGERSASAYAALVTPNGTLRELNGTNFPSVNGRIFNVAINRSGEGIIGGRNLPNGAAYAALVAQDGALTELDGSNFPSIDGRIFSVSINDSGVGIIGGGNFIGNKPYAALVAPDGVLNELSGGSFFSNSGDITSVAINNCGTAIIGGSAEPGFLMYAALVAPNGAVAELSGGNFPLVGSINSVAINRSGEGIIGGQNDVNGPAYAALVASNGALTELGNLPLEGEIFSVAINDAGVGIIGGQSYVTGAPYAAFVAPNGALTELDLESSLGPGPIYSVAILDAIVPKSYGPGSSVMNSLFPLTTQVLPNHSMYYHKDPYNRAQHTPSLADQEIGLVADATDMIRINTPCLEDPTYSIWLTGFGTYAHQKKDQNFVALTNWIGGGMIGFDYRGIQNTVIGIGGAYAYNHVHYTENAGHARFHQEFLTLYGSWNRKHLFINAALWGGLYQLKNERITLGMMTSTANIDGKLLVPHLEISAPFHPMDSWFVIEPFAMLDWANNWQGKVREHGAPGFNVKIGSTYTSMLRSEIGLRFFESIHYLWGDLILQEKASYVNKLPFHTNEQRAAFVASVSSFGIEVFSSKTQNLGVVQLSSHFIPCSKKYPYGALNYQGEFGSSFQSHLISIEVGKYF